jgi:hypothetical protein
VSQNIIYSDIQGIRALARHIREGVRASLAFFASIRLRYHGLVCHPKVIKKQCAHDDMLEVVVNLNIIVYHAVLLLISIYISNPRPRISGVAFHLDVLHHLTLIVKIS